MDCAFDLFFLIGVVEGFCIPKAAFAGSHEEVDWDFAMEFCGDCFGAGVADDVMEAV